MRYMNSSHKSPVTIFTIVGLSFFTLAFAALSVWAYMSYRDQKTNVDSKIDDAVTIAEKEQADELEAKFLEREKQPNKSFAGPSDYGTFSFKYPKTWSVYVEKDGSTGGDYTAYFNPSTVPSVDSSASRYALVLTIEDENYEDVLDSYESRVNEGDLKTSPVKINDQSGTRLDGAFSDDIRGAAVIYKIRDKTATVQTQADTFKPDFDALIKTITFVQ